MRTATTWTTTRDSARAAREAYQALLEELGGAPSLLVVYASSNHESGALMRALQALSPVPMHGGTSCKGVMSSAGFHSREETALGLLGLRDPDGDFGVGVAEIVDDARAAGEQAIRRAIAAAGRPGEPPELVWLSGVPGHEESVLLGIQDVIGRDVPIAGGSTADNDVRGTWQQFANHRAYTNAAVVTAMYPSTEVLVAFHSGYSPTVHHGVATRASGRVLHEIDGEPAAHVYNRWTNGLIDDYLGGGNVLGSTAMFPLGRRVERSGPAPFHRLSHPDQVTPDGALTLFTNIAVGDRLRLMSGTRESLVTRAGRVAHAALESSREESLEVSGALVVYCAGCMLAVQDDMDRVAAELRQALGGQPFLGTFTFGEQGCFACGASHHGNLMISVAIFTR